MKIYQKPAVELVMLREVEELCGVSNNKPSTPGIDSEHEDYTPGTWGDDTGDDIKSEYEKYSSKVWGE